MPVVAEIGDKWSPHTAPESIAPSTGNKSGNESALTGKASPLNVVSIGTAIGINSAMVPHDEPVISDMRLAILKIMNGKMALLIEDSNVVAIYCPVMTSSLSIIPNAQTRISIEIAECMSSTPPISDCGITRNVIVPRASASPQAVANMTNPATHKESSVCVLFWNASKKPLVPPNQEKLPIYR